MGVYQGISVLFFSKQYLNIIQIVLTPPGYAKDVRTALDDHPPVH